LDITDGKLKPIPASTGTALLPKNGNAVSFDMKKGWQRGGDESDTVLHWFPFDDPNAGLWAYIDGKLIRSDGGDSVTIFDVSAH